MAITTLNILSTTCLAVNEIKAHYRMCGRRLWGRLAGSDRT